MAERLSAAGPATAARDRVLDGGAEAVARAGGVLFNPRNFPWVEQECNVDYREKDRIEKLNKDWYGQAVGDEGLKVSRDELDPWQKFAYDVVCQGGRAPGCGLRMLLLGSAGTGKSRTVRSFVGAL